MKFKNFVFVCFVCFTALLMCGCDANPDASPPTGLGSSPAGTAIRTCDGLQAMKNDLSGKYVLMNDIDCSATRSWNNGKGFKPVGAYVHKGESAPFTGTFIGNNKKIRGLFINRPELNTGTGLFGFTDKAKISGGIIFENVDITGGKDTGSFIGYANTSIANVQVSGVVTGAENLGGVVGRSYVSLTRVVSSAFVRCLPGENQKIIFGGIVGISAGDIYYSKSSGNVECPNGDYVGGLVGYQLSGRIDRSSASGNVTGRNSVGGLASRHNLDSKNALLIDSYAKGSVTGNNKVGGLLGSASCNIENKIVNCYASGRVTGSSKAGGLIGEGIETAPLPEDRRVFIKNSYWDKETTGMNSMCGVPAGEGHCPAGEGYTTTDMKKQSTFVGWDFGRVWRMPVNDYPELR